MFFRPEPFRYYGPNVRSTNAQLSETFHFGHQFRLPFRNMNLFMCLHNFSLSVWITFGCSILFIFAFLLLQTSLLYPPPSPNVGQQQHHSRKTPSHYCPVCLMVALYPHHHFGLQPNCHHHHFERGSHHLQAKALRSVWLDRVQLMYRRFPHVMRTHTAVRSFRSVCFVPPMLMMFVLSAIFINLIKTDKLVPDTRFVLNTVDDVIRSDYPICTVKIDTTDSMLRSSYRNSPAYKIWNSRPKIIMDANKYLYVLMEYQKCLMVSNKYYL